MTKPTNQSKQSAKSIQIMQAETYNLFPPAFADGVLNLLTSTPKEAESPKSGQAKNGIIKYPHPISMDAVYALKDISGHHSSCIQAKKYATVGLGFIDEGDNINKVSSEEDAMQMAQSLLSGRAHVMSKVDDKTDPFTNFGFMDELLAACEDYQDVGTGYLEVHRNDSGEVDGISHVSAKYLWPCTYNGRLFYEYSPYAGQTKYWVPFGMANREWLKSVEGPFKGNTFEDKDISELIVFMKPTNRCKYYGYPDWLSAAVDIDLLKKSKQYKADFYHNRGVLDKVFAVLGAQVDGQMWKSIENAFKGTIGGTNNFGSIALNVSDPNAKLEVINVGADGNTEEQFAKDVETLTQNIVSSHRVPPLLANILIPGKLGASNEFVNALLMFELLVIIPDQNIFEKALAKTLGGIDGIEGLEADDFRLRTITSQLDVGALDTLGKMRSEAATEGDRDLKDGVED